MPPISAAEHHCLPQSDSQAPLHKSKDFSTAEENANCTCAPSFTRQGENKEQNAPLQTTSLKGAQIDHNGRETPERVNVLDASRTRSTQLSALSQSPAKSKRPHMRASDERLKLARDMEALEIRTLHSFASRARKRTSSHGDAFMRKRRCTKDGNCTATIDVEVVGALAMDHSIVQKHGALPPISNITPLLTQVESSSTHRSTIVSNSLENSYPNSQNLPQPTPYIDLTRDGELFREVQSGPSVISTPHASQSSTISLNDLRDWSNNGTLSLREIVHRLQFTPVYAPSQTPLFNLHRIREVLGGSHRWGFLNINHNSKTATDPFVSKHAFAAISQTTLNYGPNFPGDACAVVAFQQDILHLNQTYPFFVGLAGTGMYPSSAPRDFQYYGDYKVVGYHHISREEFLGDEDADRWSWNSAAFFNSCGPTQSLLKSVGVNVQAKQSMGVKKKDAALLIANALKEGSLDKFMVARLMVPVAFNEKLLQDLKSAKEAADARETRNAQISSKQSEVSVDNEEGPPAVRVIKRNLARTVGYRYRKQFRKGQMSK